MSNLLEVNGFYGGSNTPCTVFVYEQYSGVKWYCIEGSNNVNGTYDDLVDGVDVETVNDVDTLTSCFDIETLSDLESFIDDE